MTTKLMISALRQGETGTQILEILDAVTSVDTDRVDTSVPTLQEIAF